MTTKVKSSVIDTVANTQITGLITSGQIASVANTQITGLIMPAQLGGVGSSVTSVSVTSPVTNSGSSSAPNISMPAASSGQNGYMTSTYASKLDGIAAGATNVTNNNQLTNGAGYVTSSSIPSYTSQLTNNSGFITSSSLSGYAPLTGATFAGLVSTSYGGYTSALGSNSVQCGITGYGMVYDPASGDLGLIRPSYFISISGSNILKTSATDCQKTGSSTAWTVTSDIRTKKNITNYTKGLYELGQINPKCWQYNGLANTSVDVDGIGPIADEIQKILPNSVNAYKAKLNPDDANYVDIKNFNPTEITWLLVNSVKELKSIVETQASQIAALQAIVKG